MSSFFTTCFQRRKKNQPTTTTTEQQQETAKETPNSPAESTTTTNNNNNNNMTSKPVFVLAPGAWHKGQASFQLVQDRLHAQGYETDAVEYPSVGAEPPTKGLFDDAAAVRETVTKWADAGRQVILVVHSYGGLVGAEASKGLGWKQRQAEEGKKGGITLLVYLSAFVTPKGLSILEMLGGNPLPWMDFQVRERERERKSKALKQQRKCE